MNKEKFGWGVVLLFIGSILLLDNISNIDFHWQSVFHMWPIVLIVIGINFLVPRRGIGSLITIVVTVLAVSFLTYQGIRPSTGSHWTEEELDWDMAEPQDQQEPAKGVSGTFTHDYDSTITEAYLSIHGGAIAYEITDPTNQLFRAQAINTLGSHHLTNTTNGHSAHLVFSMKNSRNNDWDTDGNKNETSIQLNANPVWHINLEMGAGSADFDLTHYKVSSLTFEGGAASFHARLGMPLQETTINTESGIADIELEIPNAAACRIVIDSGLSSKDFPGFSKQDDGSYTTDNFTETTNHFTVHLKGGLSSFSVKRYQ